MRPDRARWRTGRTRRRRGRGGRIDALTGLATAEGRKLACCHGSVDPVVSVVQAIRRFVPIADFCRSEDGCRGIGADLCASVANASGPLWAGVLAPRRSGATGGEPAWHNPGIDRGERGGVSVSGRAVLREIRQGAAADTASRLGPGTKALVALATARTSHDHRHDGAASTRADRRSHGPSQRLRLSSTYGRGKGAVRRRSREEAPTRTS